MGNSRFSLVKPFSISLLQVYHTLIHMGIMPDTAITNSAISACDKGEAGTRSEQHCRWSAEVDASAHHPHLELNMWDDLSFPAEVNIIALPETSPLGCRRPVAVSSGHLQLHDRAGPEAGRHHLFQPHQCPGQGQAVGDCTQGELRVIQAQVCNRVAFNSGSAHQQLTSPLLCCSMSCPSAEFH